MDLGKGHVFGFGKQKIPPGTDNKHLTACIALYLCVGKISLPSAFGIAKMEFYC